MNDFQLFEKLYISSLLVFLCFQFPVHWKTHRLVSRFPSTQSKKLKLLGIVHIPQLSLFYIRLFQLLFLTSLIGGVLITPLFYWIASVCYFIYFKQIIIHADIRRKTNTIVLVLLVFSFYTTKDVNEWVEPLVLIKIILSQVYLSSAIHKLRRSPFQWVDGKRMKLALLDHYMFSNNESLFKIANNKTACIGLSWITVLFELTFPLVIFFPILELPYCLLGILFHMGTSYLLGINYMYYIFPIYWVLSLDFVRNLL